MTTHDSAISADAPELKRRVRDEWGARAHAFDEGSDDWVSRTPQVFAAWRDVFAAIFGPAPKDVLDVGSGTGELALLFHSLGHRVRGIDLTPQMLEIARAKARSRGAAIPFEQGDAESPGFRDASFDVVHVRHVLQLLPDPHAALAQWVRIVRPGGMVFVSQHHAVPQPLPDRFARACGRAILLAFHAAGIDRRPVSRAGPMDEAVRSRMPFRDGVSGDGLRAFLSSGGLEDVQVRDLAWVRVMGRDAMTWYRRWGSTRKREYHGAWGRKPA